MVRDLDGRRHGYIDDLATARQTQAAQTHLTRGAREQPMLHDLSGRGAWSPSILPRVTLFARLLLGLRRFLLVRFNERWWRRFQLLQFLNARLSDAQLLAENLIFGLHGAQLLLRLTFPLLTLAQLLLPLIDPLQYLTEFLF